MFPFVSLGSPHPRALSDLRIEPRFVHLRRFKKNNEALSRAAIDNALFRNGEAAGLSSRLGG